MMATWRLCGLAMIGLLLGAAAPVQVGAAAPVPIAYDQDLPPYAEVSSGQPEGLTVDLLRAALARADLTATFIPVPFARGPRTMDDGTAVAYFPLAITPDRQEKYDFSAPLVATSGALFVKAPAAAPDGLDAMSGKVVVTPGTGPLAAFIRRTAPRVILEVTKDYEESLDRLMHGTAAAAALNVLSGTRIAARLYPGQVTRAANAFWELPLAVAVPKGQSAELLARLNQGLAAIHADGTWDAINKRWATP